MRHLLWMFVCVLGWSALAEAQDATAPTRSARINFLQGRVTVDGDGQSFDAQLNMAAISGQRISTGDDGQAEIEFEDGNLVRLTPNSAVALTSLTSDSGYHATTQLDLLNGLLYLETRAISTSSYFVNAAGERITPVENSVFRVAMDVLPAEISVLQGAVAVSRDGGFSTRLNGGETLRSDSKDSSRYFLTQTVPEQSWDRWNEERDQAALNEANLATNARDSQAGSQGYGWSDLDAYGDWYDLPGEGRVWQPNGADVSSFDPYGYGSWVYYPTGYVWASGYAWGWTPFRCGSWNYWGGFGWGWQSSGCSPYGAGWGGAGYGYGGGFVRMRRTPPGYEIPTRPISGPNRGPGQYHPRPIVTVRAGPGPAIRSTEGGTRPIVFNGQTVLPLQRVTGYTQRGGSAIGAGLQKDYPIDPKTQRPVVGTQPSQVTPAVQPGIGWRSVGGGAAAPGAAPAVGAPAPGGQYVTNSVLPANGTVRPDWVRPSGANPTKSVQVRERNGTVMRPAGPAPVAAPEVRQQAPGYVPRTISPQSVPQRSMPAPQSVPQMRPAPQPQQQFHPSAMPPPAPHYNPPAPHYNPPSPHYNPPSPAPPAVRSAPLPN